MVKKKKILFVQKIVQPTLILVKKLITESNINIQFDIVRSIG